MKKRKVLGFTALGVLLAYVVCLFVIYFISDARIEEFIRASTGQDIYDISIAYDLPKDSNSIYKKDWFVYHFGHNNPNSVCAAGIYDKNGELLAQSQSYISLTFCDSEHYVEKIYYCNLDEYLTPQMKEDIANETDDFATFRIRELYYNLDENKIIPIKLIYDAFSDEVFELNFSQSDKADEYLFDASQDETTVARLSFVNLPKSKMQTKIYNELSTELKGEDMKALMASYNDVKDTKIDYEKNHAKAMAIFADNTADEPYRIVILTQRMPFTTLTDELYLSMLALVTIICLCILVLTLIITNIIYNKNKHIEDSRKAFINAAAHELKTPLAVISNNCECALENVSPEKTQNYLESSYKQTQQMSNLVTSLLNYNRMMNNDKIDKKEIDLGTLASRECYKYKTLFDTKNMKLKENIESSVVSCDEKLMCLALDNFLSNAYKYGSMGGEVEVTVKTDKKTTILSVYNTCEGISEEDMPHIWEEMYTADKSRNSNNKSTGMGLAINKKIFELHKFKYSCSNTKSGVEFSVIIK